MLINVLKSKISYATVSDKNLYYVGSIAIDENIMQQVNIQENEKVQIVNLNNSEHFETYVITGKRDSLIFSFNGPAAQKCEIDDEIFILSYAMMDPAVEKLRQILVDIKNKG